LSGHCLLVAMKTAPTENQGLLSVEMTGQ